MDQLDSRLKDLILFVNENSKFDVYAVEFEYYKHEEFEIIIPKLYGTEVKKDINVASAGLGKLITEEEFFNQAKESGDTTFARIKELFDLAQSEPFSYYWGTKTLNIRIKIDGIPSKVLEINPNGKFFVNFLEGEARERLTKTLFAEIDKIFDLEGMQNNPERKFKGAVKALGEVTDQDFKNFIETLKQTA